MSDHTPEPKLLRLGRRRPTANPNSDRKFRSLTDELFWRRRETSFRVNPTCTLIFQSEEQRSRI
jgi:hypothetical protein